MSLRLSPLRAVPSFRSRIQHDGTIECRCLLSFVSESGAPLPSPSPATATPQRWAPPSKEPVLRMPLLDQKQLNPSPKITTQSPRCSGTKKRPAARNHRARKGTCVVVGSLGSLQRGRSDGCRCDTPRPDDSSKKATIFKGRVVVGRQSLGGRLTGVSVCISMRL